MTESMETNSQTIVEPINTIFESIVGLMRKSCLFKGRVFSLVSRCPPYSSFLRGKSIYTLTEYQLKQYLKEPCTADRLEMEAGARELR